MKTNILIFASGSGSNAENLINSYKDTSIHVSAVFCNKPEAYVLTRAQNHSIAGEIFTYKEFQSDAFLDLLSPYKPDFIILAGFLLKVPIYLVRQFENRIINIHPSLLPKYGGKGMYGEFVHKAVLDNAEKKSGITIHLVNEHYDEGAILFQASCDITANETIESLAAKVHELEYRHFPKVVSDYILNFQG